LNVARSILGATSAGAGSATLRRHPAAVRENSTSTSRLARQQRSYAGAPRGGPAMQQSFAVILTEADGEERYRSTILAANQDAAVEKAERMAARLNVEVEMVEPMLNMPMARVTLLAEETAEEAERAPGSDRAARG
jgi:hypothetical protein